MPVQTTKRSKPVSKTRKSAGMRDKIVRVAIETINAKSYALATLTEIAASLDLSDAALYHYFPSKQALAYACHRHSLERFEHLLTLAEERGGTGRQKLRRLIRGMLIDSAQHGPQLYFGDYSYLDAAQRKAITTWFERLRILTVRLIEEGMADASIVECEAELVVQLLFGMLIWMAKWVPSVKKMTVERLMGAIEASVFHGLDRVRTAPSHRVMAEQARDVAGHSRVSTD